MKFILSIFFLLANFIGNSQDLAEGVYDSVKVFPSSNIKLAYKGNITAVYWEKTLLFQPSKNFYYYFEEKGFLGEVDYDTKEIFFTVFDKTNGNFEKHLKDQDLINLRSRPYNGYCGNSKLSELQKATQRFIKTRAWNLDIEVFEDKIYVKHININQNESSIEEKKVYKSKIFDMSSNDWTIKEGIKSVQEINEYLLIGLYDNSIFYDVYELKDSQPLIKILSISKENEKLYQKIFNADSISPCNEGLGEVNTYNIFKGEKIGLIESNLFINSFWTEKLNLLVPAEFDFIIPLVSNGSFLTQKGSKLAIYDNYHREEMKLTSDTNYLPSNTNDKRYTDKFPINYYYSSKKEASRSFLVDIINDSLLFIIDNQLEEFGQAYDNEGGAIYDEEGFPTTELYNGNFKSGIYNINSQKWIIPNSYYEIYYLKGFVISVIPEIQVEYGEFRTGLYHYDIFDLNGNLILKNVREGDTSVLELFYPESKVTSLGNNEYYIEQDGIYHWIEFSFSNGELFKDLELKRSNTEWVHKVRHQSNKPFDPKEVKAP
ncbi:MAG: hypothetical protein ACI8Q1_001117 [Parvicella sp.]|jgi:hypothetical protein